MIFCAKETAGGNAYISSQGHIRIKFGIIFIFLIFPCLYANDCTLFADFAYIFTTLTINFINFFLWFLEKMHPNESTDKGSEASTSRESAEGKLIVFIVHDWEIYCLDELYVSV